MSTRPASGNGALASAGCASALVASDINAALAPSLVRAALAASLQTKSPSLQKVAIGALRALSGALLDDGGSSQWPDFAPWLPESWHADKRAPKQMLFFEALYFVEELRSLGTEKPSETN